MLILVWNHFLREIFPYDYENRLGYGMHEYVLSAGEIVRLKKYIEQKYINLDVQQRLSIWSDAAHRIIEKRLPDFPMEIKKQLRSELLHKNRETFVIHQDDALRECMTLDLSQEQLIAPLVTWVSSKVNLPEGELEDKDKIVRETLLRQSGQPMTVQQFSFQSLDGEWLCAEQKQNAAVLTGIEEAAITRAYEPVSMPVSDIAITNWNNKRARHRISIAIASVCLAALLAVLFYPTASPSDALEEPLVLTLPVIQTNERLVDGIPAELRYVDVNKQKLKHYLQQKNSVLADEPYLTAIIESSKQYDIHPLLMFAITGQEQSFVPKDHRNVKEIANNPFNVFGSWESYNTTIEGSATIAAKTVYNVSSRRPGASHPIQWLNQTYAEDPNWWKGVTWFFETMLEEIEDTTFDWPE